MLPQFLHAKSPLEPATDYILCTKPPFYLGKVIQFKEYQAAQDFIESKRAKDGYFLGCTVPDYLILVVYSGELLKEKNVNAYAKIHYIKEVLEEMAADYLTNRIKQREQRFKRYKTEGNGI